METYREFLNRINSFERRELVLESQFFLPNRSVLVKVDESNHFSGFYGDTVVFGLDHDTKKKVSDIVDRLYRSVPACFCEKLVADTFHMTLHDLSNAPVLSDIATEVFENEMRLIETLKTQPVKLQTIKMKTNYVIDMMHTSLVLALYPVDKNEYIKLMQLYYLVDRVKTLPYPFTPHITLAYYNRNGFNENSVHQLEAVVNQLNKSSFEITLSTDKLVYQKFTSMNDYVSVFNLFEKNKS